MRADPKVVPEAMPLAELREKYPPGSAKRVFVVSDTGAFTGTLDIAALHDAPPEEEPDRRIAGDFASDPANDGIVILADEQTAGRVATRMCSPWYMLSIAGAGRAVRKGLATAGKEMIV